MLSRPFVANPGHDVQGFTSGKLRLGDPLQASSILRLELRNTLIIIFSFNQGILRGSKKRTRGALEFETTFCLHICSGA